MLGLAPYLCVWLVARSVLSAWPGLGGAGELGRFGWMAVWTAAGSILLYFAALMSTHIAAFRTARNIRRAAMTHVLKLPLGFFTGNQSGQLRKLIDDNAGLTEDLLAHKLPDLAATAVTPIAAIVVLFLFDWQMGLLCPAHHGAGPAVHVHDDGRQERRLLPPLSKGDRAHERRGGGVRPGASRW